jgi:hypothetical protein
LIHETRNVDIESYGVSAFLAEDWHESVTVLQGELILVTDPVHLKRIFYSPISGVTDGTLFQIGFGMRVIELVLKHFA